MDKILVVMNLDMKRLDSWIEFNLAFLRESKKRGCRVKYLLPVEPCDLIKEKFADFGTWYSVAKGWLFEKNSTKQKNLWLAGYINKKNSNEKYDLITFHFCNEITAALVSIFSKIRLLNTKIIWHQHSNIVPLPEGFHLKKIFSKLKILSLLVDYICPVFNKQKEILIDRCLDKNKIVVIYNGIDPMHYSCEFDLEAYRKEMKLSTDQKIVLTVGSLIERKRIDLFIKAARVVIKKNEKVIFIIVGEGPLLKELNGLVNELHLVDHVRFLGTRNDVDRLLRISDIFVLCSSAEGFPLVNVEACAAGTVVVSTNVSGVSELIKDNQTGLLIEPNNEEMLASKILELLNEPQKANRLSSEAKMVVSEKFNLKTMVNTYLELYQIGKKGSFI